MISRVTVIAFLLASSSSSFAFTLNGRNPNMKGWSDPEIKLKVNLTNCPAGVDVAGIIEEAAEVWNNVPSSSMKVSYGGLTTTTGLSSPSTVVCEPNFQATTNLDEDGVPGAAGVDSSSGQIEAGILYLNVSSGRGNIANFDRNVLTIILAHEIGHILGLGHSGSTHALMYYDGSLKETLSLSQDDIDGVSYLYPSNELSDGHYAGCGLIKNLPPPSAGKMIFHLLAFLLPVAFAAWLRQRVPARAG